ncbi:unnamed protein product, partial [Phaeothamnion confervicola]
MAKDSKKKGGGTEKQAKQEARKLRHQEKQQKALQKRAAKEVGEDDIEKILAGIVNKESGTAAVTVAVCEQPPPPRANFSLTALPTGELALFGGEYYDGQDAACYNELYRWHPERGDWRLVESPKSPPPRCSHQAVCYRDFLYVFGGEFATSEQFFHHRDLWRLDLRTNRWEAVEARGQGPSARSGHRMVLWRNCIVLFGGFYEAFRESNWFNDLYILNLQEHTWQRIEIAPTAPQPTPRSGHQMAVHAAADQQVFVYGGFVKVKQPGEKSEGKVHNDMWVLKLKDFGSGGRPSWERVGKKGCPPTPRSGASMCVHKGRALLFGGVFDTEGAHHDVSSVFYNDLYALDMERRHWYRLALKQQTPLLQSGEGGDGGGSASAEAPADDGGDDTEHDFIDSDDELAGEGPADTNFVYVDENGKLVYVSLDESDGENDGGGYAGNGGGGGSGTAAEESGGAAYFEGTMGAAQGPFNGRVAMASSKSRGSGQLERKGSAPRDHVGSGAVKSGPLVAAAAAQIVASPVAVLAASARALARAARAERAAARLEAPLPRINAGLTVRGNSLVVYGGLLEVRDRAFTMDDCWSLDLNARAEWRRLLEGTMDHQVWRDQEDSELDSEAGHNDDDGDDASGSDDNDSDDDGRTARSGGRGGGGSSVSSASAAASRLSEGGGRGGRPGDRRKEGVREEIRELQARLGVDEPDRTPLVTETLRQFYTRTVDHWTREYVALLESRGDGGRYGEKELRKNAFALAEDRFAELQPVLQRLNELDRQQKKAEAEAAAIAKRKGGGG